MNIKATELRIGNLITTRVGVSLRQEDLVSVQLKHIDHILNGNLFKYEPIPLTEQYLLDFGFELCNEAKITKRYNHDINPFIELISQNNWMSHRLIVAQRQELLSHIQYIHQLQNIFFALTGSELTLNP